MHPPQPWDRERDQRLRQRPEREPPGQQDGRRVLRSVFPVCRLVKVWTD